MIAYQEKQHAEATDLFRRAAEVAPGMALFHHHLGIALAALGRSDEAAGALRQAIEIDPAMRGPRTELGLCLLRDRKYDEALAMLQEALDLDPDDAIAARNLAVCCAEKGLLGDAEKFARLAVALDPEDAGGWNNLGGILISRGCPAAAAPMYEKACERNPAYNMAYSNRLMCEQYLPGVSEERLLELSSVWQARYAPEGTAAFDASRKRHEDGRLRLGFVSRDLKRAPVGYFLVGLLEALGSEAVSIVVYSDTEGPDDLTERMRQAASLWRETRPLSDEQLLGVVRDDAIDVLFDLAGHTKANRLPVFAWRAAPVQVTWAGYVGTTGLEAMDYLLADRFQVPAGSEQHYVERILRMPHGYICYEPPFYAPDVPPLPALRQGRVTFGAFHNVAKAGASSIAAWSRVLSAVPGSGLVLKYTGIDEPLTRERLMRSFADAGIAAERIVFEGESTHIDMLRRYNDIDIALDSMPYSGGLTTCEALWMGVPVVTLPGRTFAGRHSLSHLSNVGHSELVAKDIEDYVRIAVGLAQDLSGLASLRNGLRAQMAQSPLCDARLFVPDFLRIARSVVPPA